MIANLMDNAIKYTPGDVIARTQATEFAILRSGHRRRDSRKIGSGCSSALPVLGSGEGLRSRFADRAREIAELHRATVTLKSQPTGTGTLAQVIFRAAIHGTTAESS